MRGLHTHPSHNLHILTYFSINYSGQSQVLGAAPFFARLARKDARSAARGAF